MYPAPRSNHYARHVQPREPQPFPELHQNPSSYEQVMVTPLKSEADQVNDVKTNSVSSLPSQYHVLS